MPYLNTTASQANKAARFVIKAQLRFDFLDKGCHVELMLWLNNVLCPWNWIENQGDTKEVKSIESDPIDFDPID
jgi:hypothetical protein